MDRRTLSVAFGTILLTLWTAADRDRTCPSADAEELVRNMQAAGLDVEAHFIGGEDIDGTVFTTSGHPLGNRTEIVFQLAERYLVSEGTDVIRRSGKTDFDRREAILSHHVRNVCHFILAGCTSW